MTRPIKTPRSRRRLVSPAVLILGAIAMAMALVYLFPRSSVFDQLARRDQEDRADSVKIIMLQALIEKGVQGFSLRREYIRQLGLTGNYDLALEELDTLASKWNKPRRDSLSFLQIEVASWILSADGGDKEAATRHLVAGAEGVMQSGAARHLIWAAGKAKTAGLYRQAAELYLKAAERDTLPIRWQKQAASLFASAGDCQKTSATWVGIYASTAEPAEKKAALLEALRALQACGELDAALRLAESHLRAWRDDTEILLYLVNLARAANRPQLAERYAQMLVRPLAAGPEL